MLNNIIAESVCEDLSWQWWDCYTSTLTLKDVAEVFKVRVATANTAVAQLEGWDVGAALDLVGCVHVATDAMGLWVLDLNLEEVLWWAVDLLEALLTRIWHSLHLVCCVASPNLRNGAYGFVVYSHY